ncbi:type IV pilus inner membrane component PilO [Hippea jasoniae]|uniref:type 4a pilus biogenesis protein PilO n=1 Tax=Hippea jasoniae TaxID=944479 RepID=UPI000558B9E4|nr:type 4a pilus biogenesis protein PilO [Hippea jasoniae]
MGELDNKKIALIVIGLLILPALWYYLYFSDANAKINKLRGEIERLQKYQSQLPILKRNYIKAKNEFKVYSAQLPLKEEIPSLLVQLNGIVRSEGVSLLSFSPRNAALSSSKLYYTKPIAISIKANYTTCGEVFERISKMKRLVKVKDFTINNPKIVNSKLVIMNINFNAETYYFNKKVK